MAQKLKRRNIHDSLLIPQLGDGGPGSRLCSPALSHLHLLSKGNPGMSTSYSFQRYIDVPFKRNKQFISVGKKRLVKKVTQNSL